MSAKERALKRSLVRARQVISDKFRRLNRNRVMQEKELETKYAPITNSINKLIDTQTKMFSQKNDIDWNKISYIDDKKQTIADNAEQMDLDEAHDNNESAVKSEPTIKFIKNDVKSAFSKVKNDFKAVFSKSKKENEEQQEENILEPTREKNIPSDLVRIYAPKYDKTVSKTEKILTNARELTSSNRKNKRIENYDTNRLNEYDSVVIYPENEFTDQKIPFISKRTFKKEPPLTSEKILINKRNSLSTKRKCDRFEKHDTHRFDNDYMDCTVCRKRQTEIVCPEDYDDNGNFVGLAPKRRKVERPLKCNVKRKRIAKKAAVAIPKNETESKRDQTVEYNLLATKPKTKTKKKLTVSLDDFNDKGEYMGLAPKRRKIEINENKLIQIRNDRKQRTKKQRIKYDGKGIEKKFIPYSENIVYEYYDDPNELVERLMLLISSKSAGNTNHDQEINSILEELRERNIIH